MNTWSTLSVSGNSIKLALQRALAFKADKKEKYFLPAGEALSEVRGADDPVEAVTPPADKRGPGSMTEEP